MEGDFFAPVGGARNPLHSPSFISFSTFTFTHFYFFQLNRAYLIKKIK